MSLDNVWVFAQGADGAANTATLELLTKARSIGDNVSAFVVGDASSFAAQLGEYGAAKVFATGDLGDKFAGPAGAAAIAALIEGGESPDLIMFPQNYDGRDVMSRLSVLLDRTVLTNNTEIDVDSGKVHVTTQIFGGEKLVTSEFTGETPYLANFRPKSFEAEAGGAGAAEVVEVPVPDLGAVGAASVKVVHVEETTGPKLDEAAVVVAGGRGLGEAANFSMIDELAGVLHGAPGATRAIVDAGWVPYAMQIGQTGKVVKPNVYIAAGVSGATQHMVGMKGSKHIIAINKDEEAPIFGVADLGIVGDIHKVMPKLIEALNSR